MTSFIPELLSPAGSLEKLKVSVSYGADAVYLAGQKYGLRTAADNFTRHELIEGVHFAHQNNAKVYVVLNSFFHDDDFDGLVDFLNFLELLNVDALIVSDLGVINYIRTKSRIPIHLSTQASCLNTYAARYWAQQGVTRIVLGREVTISEAAKIKKEAGIEVEMFIHGSMCMAYSGNCVISNYTSGRDSNRGGCAHSCRFEYELDYKGKKKNSFFMSSKDLNGLIHLQSFVDAEIDSLKVEGRMKGSLYAGTISKVYSEAIDIIRKNGSLDSHNLERLGLELNKVSHRDYTEGSLSSKADANSIYHDRETETKEYLALGTVLELDSESLICEVRNGFNRKCEIEAIPFEGREIKFNASTIKSMDNQLVERARPSTLVKLPIIDGVMPGNILRTRVPQMETVK